MADASLFCCSEYFVSTDYNRSLTWKRKDLLTRLFLRGYSGPKRQVMIPKVKQSDAKEERRRNRESHIRLYVQRMKVIHWEPVK